MTEQARKVQHEAMPEWAEGLYYSEERYSEVLVYYDDEALYVECKGQDSGVMRFSFEMLETLDDVAEEIEEERPEALGKQTERA